MGSNERREIQGDAIDTAEDRGSYKPEPANLEDLISHVASDGGLGASEILHTAQSTFHDHVPAATFGLTTCWIDRRWGQDGAGATSPVTSDVNIDFRFQSMAEFADAHRQTVES